MDPLLGDCFGVGFNATAFITFGGSWLKGLTVPMDPNVLKNVLGSSVTIKPIAFLYLPGAVFILASLMTFRLHRMSTPAMLLDR